MRKTFKEMLPATSSILLHPFHTFYEFLHRSVTKYSDVIRCESAIRCEKSFFNAAFHYSKPNIKLLLNSEVKSYKERRTWPEMNPLLYGFFTAIFPSFSAVPYGCQLLKTFLHVARVSSQENTRLKTVVLISQADLTLLLNQSRFMDINITALKCVTRKNLI